jgi:adenosylhomocysteine nucleosidase
LKREVNEVNEVKEVKEVKDRTGEGLRMKVLVTFAVEAEFAAWRRLRAFNLIDYQGLKLRRTVVGAAEITVLITGVGTQAAAQAMDLMMRMADKDQYFDVCVSSGLAGALCETLGVGDIIAPKELIIELKHGGQGAERLEVDTELREFALGRGAKNANCLFTTDEILVKASQKRSCASRAQSVDMESFEIVKAASAWGARSVVIRAISDAATEDLPINFNLTLSEQKEVRLSKVLMQIARNPLALPSLIRFGRQSKRAGTLLAEFLESYLQDLAGLESSKRVSEVAAR